jgi:hypothetical protein
MTIMMLCCQLKKEELGVTDFSSQKKTFPENHSCRRQNRLMHFLILFDLISQHERICLSRIFKG